MYLSFVIEKGGCSIPSIRVLNICGKDYTAYSSDPFIDEAIDMASHWPLEQVGYRRIVLLRSWLRENFQFAYNIPYKHIYDVQSCLYFIESVMQGHYHDLGENYKEAFDDCMEENAVIFSYS